MQTKVELADIASAILDHRTLDARQNTHDFWADTPDFAQVLKPSQESPTVLVICAALLELFAARRGQRSPTWTATVGGLDKPLFLVPEFEAVPYQRSRCLRDAPRPLKERNLFAPSNYLAFA